MKLELGNDNLYFFNFNLHTNDVFRQQKIV